MITPVYNENMSKLNFLCISELAAIKEALRDIKKCLHQHRINIQPKFVLFSLL